MPRTEHDSKTPASVVLRSDPHPRYADPTVGVPVDRSFTGTPTHRLVTIGDSLTQGLQSGSLHTVNTAYPVVIARALGIEQTFRYARFDDGVASLPFAIEHALHLLEAHFGTDIASWETPRALSLLRKMMDATEDYWERGPGATPSRAGGIKHNLSVYNWDLRDVLGYDADILAARIGKAHDHLLAQFVEDANLRVGHRVLESARDAWGRPLTIPQAARTLSEAGTIEDGTGDGIETLIVMLGANNALGAVGRLKVRWSKWPDYLDLDRKRAFQVWAPEHFEAELGALVRQIQQVRARHVIFSTVPHVTSAPLGTGIGSRVGPDGRYFQWYTRPWTDANTFDPNAHPRLDAQQARTVDAAIDHYNESIARVVREARQAGRDWYIYDLCTMLERLGHRRTPAPNPLPEDWDPYPLPDAIAALTPEPTSSFYVSGPNGRTAGGLVSLDGIHPTTIGYAMMAQGLIRIMEDAGVVFRDAQGTPRSSPVEVDWAEAISADALIANPPLCLGAGLKALGRLDAWVSPFYRIFL